MKLNEILKRAARIAGPLAEVKDWDPIRNICDAYALAQKLNVSISVRATSTKGYVKITEPITNTRMSSRFEGSWFDEAIQTNLCYMITRVAALTEKEMEESSS